VCFVFCFSATTKREADHDIHLHVSCLKILCEPMIKRINPGGIVGPTDKKQKMRVMQVRRGQPRDDTISNQQRERLFQLGVFISLMVS
jgi:hypothetical protein